MKKTILSLILVTFIIPFTSYAAPLTNQQSVSLINVVKSSTSTPASAFVGLITAFSNITPTQAESLIVVIQASPEAPADAFVNLLMSFTVDPVVLGGTIPPVIQPNQPPVVETQPVDKSDIVVVVGNKLSNSEAQFGEYPIRVAVLDKNGKNTRNEFTMTDGVISETKAPNQQSVPDANDWIGALTYSPTSTDTKTLTFTANGLSKTVTIEVQ